MLPLNTMEPMDEDAVPSGGDIRYGEINPLNTSETVQAGIQAGNIFRASAAEAEVLDLPEARIRRALSQFWCCEPDVFPSVAGQQAAS